MHARTGTTRSAPSGRAASRGGGAGRASWPTLESAQLRAARDAAGARRRGRAAPGLLGEPRPARPARVTPTCLGIRSSTANHLPPPEARGTGPPRHLGPGANTGFDHGAFGRSLPQARVIGVELDDANARLAARNVEPWSERCAVVPGSRVDRGRRGALHHHESVSGYNVVADDRPEGDAPRPLVHSPLLAAHTLDEPVDYLKMDVKGPELERTQAQHELGASGAGDPGRGAPATRLRVRPGSATRLVSRSARTNAIRHRSSGRRTEWTERPRIGVHPLYTQLDFLPYIPIPTETDYAPRPTDQRLDRAPAAGARHDPTVATGATHGAAARGLGRRRCAGPHRVTDQNPEDKYQALEKFGRDLTEAAEDGQARPGHRPRRRDPPRRSRSSRGARRTTRC